ncbi:MAG: xanthine dehydrogenase family protein subunit M [Acidobacteria bacterium]|nr:xanthine dehydrogenase family protein subunit M [Acidobacteriota bacterium]
MRANLPNFDLRVPSSLDEALRLMADEPGVWRLFAGGTDLMVLLEAGKLDHKCYLSIRHLTELRGIEKTCDYIKLGALITYTQVQGDAVLREEFPMLCEAASLTGGIAIQNRGTLGGNIANASPAADSLPALLVYQAELELVSARGPRWVPYQNFHTGYKTTVMREDELIKAIRLPRTTQGWQQQARKVGTRKAQAISKVCFAGMAQTNVDEIQNIRLAFGSVAPMPLRVLKTEAVLKNRKIDAKSIKEARAELAGELSPIDDMRSTADYRLQVAANLLEEFLYKLILRL